MEKKKEKKVVKTSETVSKKKESKTIKNDNGIMISDTKRIVRCVTYIATFFASIFAIIVFVFGLISTLSVLKDTSGEVLHNNFTMTFVSKVSNSTLEETKLSYMASDSKFVYALFNVVLPTIALICVAILVILLCNLVLKFISDTNNEKDLFNDKKLTQAENIVNILSIIIFINWVLFNNPSMPFALLIFLLLYIIYYLFKVSVNKYSKEK